MTAIITFFHLWSIPSVIARLIIATLAGTTIGLDREAKNKEAGVKTHALVCMGAALAIIVNEFAFYQFPGSNIDITRMGAQVISGIGFLGGWYNYRHHEKPSSGTYYRCRALGQCRCGAGNRFRIH